MNWLREADAEPLPGYRLIEPIGSGGFGEVWKCTAPGGILKAIKFVYGNLNGDDGDAIRAEQEQKALQRVKDVRHPFVLSMDRIEIVGGELAIVMELADKSLHDLLQEFQARGYKGIPRNDVVRYLLDAADGLDHLIEKHNLQHLDVKPRNLFVIADRVKVADFGLVKQIERQSAAGLMGGMSPLYGAPETFTDKVSKHSDQYSLAIVYCELVSGRRPFAGKNVRQLAMQHQYEAPDLSMLQEGDRAVLNQALAKDPSRRFPSCQAFIKALSPTIVQTVASIDLDAEEADIGKFSTAPEGPDTERLDSVPQEENGHPATGIFPNVLRYRVETGVSDIIKGDDDEDWEAPPTAVHSNGPPSQVSDPDAFVDLGAPTRGPQMDLTASKLSRGLLRPTLFLGIGAFGRRALTEVRTRLLDRFGDPEQIPAYRFLFADSDPQSIDLAGTGPPEIALGFAETFQLPLQPVIAYRRKMIDHLTLWLPKEKLHSIPRSLQPQGSRALGRLAFIDNYPRLQTRLRRELQVAMLPDSVELSAAHTGLSRGKNTPRVFVFGSACGGSSGMLVDLGYALRRLLRQLNVATASVVLFNYCGSPHDPSTSRAELANVYATLVELNHYTHSDMAYSAHFGPDGPQVSDLGPPFDATYLLTAKERSPEAVRNTVAHVATYVTQDVSTPLGPMLEQARKTPFGSRSSVFRSFGTATAWFPRGLLLRVAARRACARLIDVWTSPATPKSLDFINQQCAKILADPGLRWETLSAELNRLASMARVGTPIEATEQFLEQIEKDAAGPLAAENPGAWAHQVVDNVRRWAGPGSGRELEALWKKSQFYKQLTAASQQLGGQWDEYLAEQLRDLIRRPGHRLAVAEAGLRRIIEFCDRAVHVQWEAIEKHYQNMKKLREEVETSLSNCQGGVKMLFGGPARALRHFLDVVRQFARQRIAQDILEAGVQFFMTLRGRLEDRIRELGFAKSRLKQLQKILMTPMRGSSEAFFGEHGENPFEITDPFWNAVQETETVQIVLPAGIDDLEMSADQFVQSLRPEHWLSLDEWLQGEVLAPMGDLHNATTSGNEVSNSFGRPLIEQAAWHLGTILPITDVAQVEFSSAESQSGGIGERLGNYVNSAEPMFGATGRHETFMLIPDTESGQAFGRAAIGAFNGVQVVPMANPIELTVLREQVSIPESQLQEIFEAAQDVYREVVGVPALSPHSRFDMNQWKVLCKDREPLTCS